MKTKDRILICALDLFNHNCASDVTTNDIAKELKMSPGNLYFHYKNKEQIIRELFKRLVQETEQLWTPEAELARINSIKENRPTKIPLIAFIEKNLMLHWKYRFFHRELYILRKNDPELSKLWRKHLKKISRLMIVMYKYWTRDGYMISIKSPYEIEYIGELLFTSSNSFMQFFETVDTGDKPKAKIFEKARKHLMRMLMPYLSGETKDEFEKFFKN